MTKVPGDNHAKVKPTPTPNAGDPLTENRKQAAITCLHEIKRLNDDMQKQFAKDSASWHHCESIDDRVHDALTALGD